MVDYWEKSHRLRGTISHWALVVRRRLYQSFLGFVRPGPGDTIVDIGVTPDTEFEDTNFLERWYPHPSQITATSIEDASVLEQQFPGLRFVQTTDGPLPFDDHEFTVSFSSAVVEHVGNRQQQRAFVREQLRVSDRFFITTPNRWYPLELHTILPFIHWLPQPVHQQLLRWMGKDQWAKTENLNLLSGKQLRGLFPADCTVTVSGVRTFGLISNLYAYGTSPKCLEER